MAPCPTAVLVFISVCFPEVESGCSRGALWLLESDGAEVGESCNFHEGQCVAFDLSAACDEALEDSSLLTSSRSICCS